MEIQYAIKMLEKEYGIPKQGKCVNPMDSLIETILSQNTNDINRDRAFERLKSEFPTWEEVMDAPEKKIAKAIRVGGLANIKSARIKAILREMMQKKGNLNLEYLKKMTTDDAANELFSFKGVGEKTVKCVLLFSLGRNVFPVDTHIHRLCRRMGFVRENASREETHRVMGKIVPEKKMYPFHINLIRHGRKTCTARKPDCPNCPLSKICPKII
jgi:endonuclease III